MSPVAGPLLRRSLARDVTRHYWHNCLNKAQARALTLVLLNPSGDRPVNAVIALSEAKGWTQDACAPDLTRMLLDIAPGHRSSWWTDLRRHSAELADVEAQIDALKDGPASVDAYLNDGEPCWDRGGYRGGYRDQIVADLSSNAAYLRAERVTMANWLVGVASNGAPLAVTP